MIPDYPVILLTAIGLALIGVRLHPQLGVQTLLHNRHLWIDKHREKLEDIGEAT
jgi:hypothetical protein